MSAGDCQERPTKSKRDLLRRHWSQWRLSKEIYQEQKRPTTETLESVATAKRDLPRAKETYYGNTGVSGDSQKRSTKSKRDLLRKHWSQLAMADLCP